MASIQLDSYLWHRILGYLYRPPPPAQTDCAWSDLHQHDLATMMRVNSTMNFAAAPHLYRSPIVVDLHSFFYGMRGLATDHEQDRLAHIESTDPPPAARPSEQVRRRESQSQTVARQCRMSKDELFGFVRALHLVNKPLLDHPYSSLAVSKDSVSSSGASQHEGKNFDGEVRRATRHCIELRRLLRRVNKLLADPTATPVFTHLESLTLAAWKLGDGIEDLEELLQRRGSSSRGLRRYWEVFEFREEVMSAVTSFVTLLGPRYVCSRADPTPLSLAYNPGRLLDRSGRRGPPGAALHTTVFTTMLPIYDNTHTKVFVDRHKKHRLISPSSVCAAESLISALIDGMADVHHATAEGQEDIRRLEVYGLAPQLESDADPSVGEWEWDGARGLFRPGGGSEASRVRRWNEWWEQWIQGDQSLHAWKGRMEVKSYKDTPICEACGAVPS